MHSRFVNLLDLTGLAILIGVTVASAILSKCVAEFFVIFVDSQEIISIIILINNVTFKFNE